MALQAERILDAELLPIYEKVQRGERLSREDGIVLYRTPNLTGVGFLANLVRDLFVEALTGYADAAAAAATGISDQDSAQIDAAVAFIASAEETVSRATTLLQRALSGCGLDSGTPVADDTGG